MGGMVIWVTGLSGAGKTTLCQALQHMLKPRLPELALLDGDQVRAALSGDLGFSEKDRLLHIQRIQNLAKLLSDQGLVVLVAALYSNPELLQWNRRNFQEYFEIYVKTSLETLRRRDGKKLYARAFSVEIKDVVGVDIPWSEPAHPDMVINNNEPEPPEVLARRVIAELPRLARLGLEVG